MFGYSNNVTDLLKRLGGILPVLLGGNKVHTLPEVEAEQRADVVGTPRKLLYGCWNKRKGDV